MDENGNLTVFRGKRNIIHLSPDKGRRQVGLIAFILGVKHLQSGVVREKRRALR